MILRAGSTLWLLSHEVRLSRRALVAKPGMKWRAPVLLIAFIIAGLAIGVPAAFAIRTFGLHASPLIVAITALGAGAVFILMLSQCLAGATETLYARGDLDLLFSSPIAPRAVLFAKCAGIAANAFLGFALLVTPAVLPIALIARPGWFAVYGVLAALAQLATSAGLLIAILLFRIIGPKRTRVISQLLAVLIGASIFLVAQSRNLLGQRRFEASLGAVSGAGGIVARGPISWPLRALEGDPVVLAPLIIIASAVFTFAAVWTGRRFASDAAAASGATVAVRARGGEGRFADGVFQATLRKELRLLDRDIPVLGQVLLRVVFLLPLIFILLRSAGGLGAMRLVAGVGAVILMCGQVAGSLVWLTVSAEDAPELIGCAPASTALIRRAKLCAALAPLAVLMVVPLVALVAISPRAGLAATVGCVASSLVVALIGFSLQKPAKRSAFNRRGAGSLLATLAEFGAGAVVAAIASLAVVWPAVLIAPFAIAGLAAWVLWRGDHPPSYSLPKTRPVVQ